MAPSPEFVCAAGLNTSSKSKMASSATHHTSLDAPTLHIPTREESHWLRVLEAMDGMSLRPLWPPALDLCVQPA